MQAVAKNRLVRGSLVEGASRPEESIEDGWQARYPTVVS